VVLCPGLCTNANLFRVDNNGRCFDLDHNRSFANLLASEGFDVYLYHPGYCERIFNRYVSRHCKQSIYFKKHYKVPSEYGYRDLTGFEAPAVTDFVCNYSQAKNISWIGYSLGGMIAYSYLSRNYDNPIKNLITIGSPMTLNQLFFRVIPYINLTSLIFGSLEKGILGSVSQNIIPLTRVIRFLPSWLIRFNLISLYLFNPMNMSNATIRTFLGQIAEPMPKGLQRFFSAFIKKGYFSQEKFTKYLSRLRNLEKTQKNFLFFYGDSDRIAIPDSVFLAREVISPNDPNNLVASMSAGHIDLIIGKNSPEQVWRPILEWLKEKNQPGYL
jgi:pimeloyl-ACP methyl ester carboxylesterase